MDSRDATEGDEVVSLMSSLRDLEKWTAEIKFFPCKKFVRFTGNVLEHINLFSVHREEGIPDLFLPRQPSSPEESLRQ